VSWNPHSEFQLATGGAAQAVRVWDSRNLKAPVFVLKGHKGDIYNINWNPHPGLSNILSSCAADRRVMVWDLSRLGAVMLLISHISSFQAQTEEEALDGPPELLFIHGGHTSVVMEHSWNRTNPWLVASLADDRVLQVWEMASGIHSFMGDSAILSVNGGVQSEQRLPTSLDSQTWDAKQEARRQDCDFDQNNPSSDELRPDEGETSAMDGDKVTADPDKGVLPELDDAERNLDKAPL
jgi:WD40 repeat protein